jgi:C1A family cysteine protease
MSQRKYLNAEQRAARKQFRSSLPVHPLFNTVVPAVTGTRPVHTDLKSKIKQPYDQGDIGSCTANAISMALLMLEHGTPLEGFSPSRLYLYVKERLAELQSGTQLSDSGADAADGLSILMKSGVCSEAVWPYDTAKVDTIPPHQCDLDAAKHKIAAIGTVAKPNVTGTALVDAIAHSILSGIPVLIGITVYDSFESETVAQTGNVPMPSDDDQEVGGHEVLIVGYDDAAKQFLLINSWGANWGLQGYFHMPYEYITNPDLTSEFIAITRD